MILDNLRGYLITGAAVGVMVSFGILVSLNAQYRRERDDAQAKVGAGEESLKFAAHANETQRQIITELQRKQREDTASQERVSSAISTLQQSVTAQTRQLQSIEQTNAQIRDYLATPVPAELRRLFNQPGTGNAHPGADGHPAAPVAPGTGAAGAKH